MERQLYVLRDLADLKESHPIETAKYAKILGIDHEPAFNWWVPHVLSKRDRIISLVSKRNPRYLKWTHNFGTELLPKTVKEALDRGGTHKKTTLAWKNTKKKFHVFFLKISTTLSHHYL
jgi:hypothetical protein